jgi:hypothetical protein
MKYEILQLERPHFMAYSQIAKPLNIAENYRVTYTGTVEIHQDDVPPGNDEVSAALDYLFFIFNERHPEDFRSHSLSVGDIVRLDGQAHYCDSVGWKLINEKDA